MIETNSSQDSIWTTASFSVPTTAGAYALKDAVARENADVVRAASVLDGYELDAAYTLTLARRCGNDHAGKNELIGMLNYYTFIPFFVANWEV
jgi:hypothetical protein